MTRRLSLLLAVVLAFGLVSLAAAQQQDQPSAAPNPLVQLLQNKGVLTAQEATAINQAATPAEQQDRLTQLLYSKGLITEQEYKSTAAEQSRMQANRASDAQGTWMQTAAHVSAAEPEPAMAMPPQAPAAPAVIPAVTPVRVLTNEPPKPGGLVPDIKLGSGAKLKLYGFIKSTATYDTSNPYNIGFELPGLGGSANGSLPGDVPTGLNSTSIAIPGVGNNDSGPNGSPGFYLKASATRFGSNFEWPDFAGSNNTLTGRIEMDFEGNFSRAQNRNVSSLRTRMLSLRLAWARIDHQFSDSTTGFLLFGMDWTPFGSSNFANLLETEGGGAYFGSIYEREAQIRLGLWHNFGGSHNFMIGFEPALGMPSFANLPTDVGVQLGVSERQGINSGRPEVSGRVVFQWQLDKAKGVAPAQINFSGMDARRTEIVNRAAIDNVFCTPGVNAAPGALVNCVTRTPAQVLILGQLQAAFPHGYQGPSSQRWGADGGVQLPTRYATLVARYYTGADLRWYFGGQIFGVFNDNRIGLLTSSAGAGIPCNVNGAGVCPTAFDIDASAPNVTFGWNAAAAAWQVIPQRPMRAEGGFAQISFPLSRLFNANPAGRNAGWTVAFTYGTDQAKARDVRAMQANTPACLAGAAIPGSTAKCPANGDLNAFGQVINSAGQRNRSDMGVGTLTWKINQYATFSYESSLYLTKSTCDGTGIAGGASGRSCAGTLFRSLPARYWHNWRNEFGPVFVF
jgi:hypothetical protein